LRQAHPRSHVFFFRSIGYIRTAEAVRDGFGEVFPPLPPLTDGAYVGPIIVPNYAQVYEIIVEAPGIESR
jgi:hypothetical protein